MIGGFGGWAALADISGAVIAPGTLVVESDVKKVQHATGGIVGELRVRNGDLVQAGDILLRLDETLTRSNLAIADKAIDELMARKARLEAERDGKSEVAFPDALYVRARSPDVTHIMDGERRLFELRRTARDGQRAELKERTAQLEENIVGLTVRAEAKAREIDLIGRELKGTRELWKKGLTPIGKLTLLERSATQLEGERGQLISNIAEIKGRISETELQILQIDRDLSSEVGKDLREIEAKIGELAERKIAAEDQLKRTDIRAPQTGRVHELSIHTIGGVVTAGTPIMLIVPDGDILTAEAKVKPSDIDELQLGQSATLRFSAFNLRRTPEIDGRISRVSADAHADERTGANYYVVRIAIPDEQRARLGSLKLLPGMPVEVFIKSKERTVISYLVKPLSDQMQRALCEE
jgi:HlyD family secretion protein